MAAVIIAVASGVFAGVVGWVGFDGHK